MYKSPYSFIWIFILILNAQAQSVINIPKTTNPIQIDGSPDEDDWTKAVEFKNFKQLEPNLGELATEKSSVKIMYDDVYLYVSVIMNYENSSDIYGRTMERDISLSRDDYVEIHLDTYNDNTNSLVFRTNLLGAREDYEVGRNGDTVNYSWNTFWEVVTKVYTDKWTAEFRIPFSSLHYQKKEINTMRFKSVLFYKLKNERIISTLNELKRTPQVYQYKNSQEILFENLPSSKPLYLTPYIKSDFQTRNILNESQTNYIQETEFLQQKSYSKNKTLDKLLSNIGFDLKYKPNSNYIIDLTLNTDFAEVEADDRIINVTRFPIFLPEKRLFFLENQDLFNSNQFDHRLFFSRRIGISNGLPIPIIGGIRFTGNNSKWQYGAMSLQTNSFSDENLPSYNMSVARVKHIIGQRGSYIGFLSTSKVSNTDYNYLAAFDSNILFTETIRSRFTFGATFDKEKGNWKPYYGLDVNTFKSNGFGVNYRFREYNEDFNPELGFVSRPNTKRITLNHGWRKTYVNHSALRFVSLGNWTTRNWLSSNGNQDYSQSNFYFFVSFKNGLNPGILGPIVQEDNLYDAWKIADNIEIPIGNYLMWKLNPSFSTGNAFPYVINTDVEFGDFYGGKQLTISGNLQYDFNKTFTLEVGGNYNRLEFPEVYVSEGDNKLLLNRYYSRQKLSFSSKAFLNSYIQYDSNSNKIGWNLRFRYTPKEGTNLYIVYNQNINAEINTLSPRPPLFESQGLTLKFSKTFIK